MNPARKVSPAEKQLRQSLLSDLKDRISGWRKDATAKQVGKMRAPKPEAFAKGGTVENEEAHNEGKAGPGTRGIGDPTEEDTAEYEDQDAVDNDFPGASDDDDSDAEVEEAVKGDSEKEPADESFDALLKRLQRG